MGERKISCLKAIAPEFDEGRGNDGEIGNPHSQGKETSHSCTCSYFDRMSKSFKNPAGPLSTYETITVSHGDVVLDEPHKKTDRHKDRCQDGSFTKGNRGNGGIAVDVCGKNVKSDAPPQCVRGAVFGKGFHKDQQSADHIISRDQRKKYFPEPHRKSCPADRSRFIETFRNSKHGIFEESHHERKYMETHDHDQACQGEKGSHPVFEEGNELSQKAPFLHEKDPSHGSDIGRRHERHKK